MAKKKLVGAVRGKKARGLSSDEKKLFGEYGPQFWNWVCRIADEEHVSRIRGRANPRRAGLRLYYPSSASDVAVPLLLTDATEMVFVDNGSRTGKHEEKIHNELNSRGWSDCRLWDREMSYVSEGYGGDGKKRVRRTEFEFFFNNKPRTIVFYRAEPGDFVPPELESGGKEGFDVVFFKKSDEVSNREFLWFWEMLNPAGTFVGMGDFKQWRGLFKKAGVVKSKRSWNYEGSAQMEPYAWSVFSKKRPDREMSNLVQESMELVRRKKGKRRQS